MHDDHLRRHCLMYLLRVLRGKQKLMSLLGQECLCRRPGPSVFGCVSPFCWRCSGMFVGLTGLIMILTALPTGDPPHVVWWVVGTVLLGAPAVADVAAQRARLWGSSSWCRCLTGILLGGAVVASGRAVKLLLLG